MMIGILVLVVILIIAGAYYYNKSQATAATNVVVPASTTPTTVTNTTTGATAVVPASTTPVAVSIPDDTTKPAVAVPVTSQTSGSSTVTTADATAAVNAASTIAASVPSSTSTTTAATTTDTSSTIAAQPTTLAPIDVTITEVSPNGTKSYTHTVDYTGISAKELPTILAAEQAAYVAANASSSGIGTTKVNDDVGNVMYLSYDKSTGKYSASATISTGMSATSTDVTATVSAAVPVTTSVATTTASANYFTYPDTDWTGHDLSSQKVSDVNACGDLCYGTKNCGLFSFGADGVCYMKQFSSAPTAVFNVRAPSGDYMSVSGSDMSGFDIKKVNAASNALCQQACTADGSCIATTYYASSGDCYLKKPNSSGGTTSGWVRK